MLLSDVDLVRALNDRTVTISPYAPEMLQPASVDVRLGHRFLTFATHRWPAIDPAREQPGLMTGVDVPAGDPFVLHPGEFALAGTVEHVTLDAGHAARVEGKSSLGRLGLLVHSTAGFIDPGFRGRVTLELHNLAPLPLTLWPGMPIGQLCVYRLSSPAAAPYGHRTGAHYQGQDAPTESRAWQRFRTWPTRSEADTAAGWSIP